MIISQVISEETKSELLAGRVTSVRISHGERVLSAVFQHKKRKGAMMGGEGEPDVDCRCTSSICMNICYNEL